MRLVGDTLIGKLQFRVGDQSLIAETVARCNQVRIVLDLHGHTHIELGCPSRWSTYPVITSQVLLAHTC